MVVVVVVEVLVVLVCLAGEHLDLPVLHIKGCALVSQGVDTHCSVDVKLEKHT